MKSNFVVSADRRFWVPGAKNLFAINPYIVHALEREGVISSYEHIEVAPLRRMTPNSFQYDHDFVDRKLQKYILLLIDRLDRLHGTQHGEHFWRKAFSLSMLRHVTLCYEIFQACENNLDPQTHECRLLEVDAYYTPINFDDHRQYFQHSDIGQEQLFSIYCGLFFSSKFSSVAVKVSQPIHPQKNGVWKRIFRRGLTQKIVRRFFEKLSTVRQPSLGIIESFFSSSNFNLLMVKSFGRIQRIKLPKVLQVNSIICEDRRRMLTAAEASFDRFDQFVFATLQWAMPRSFIEDFPHIYNELNSYLGKFTKLRWAVDEAWIGHESSAMALAILQKYGVKHIYNEHNFLSHFFKGNSLKYLTPLVDEFVTLGWEDKTIPNLVRGASLYPWVDAVKSRKKFYGVLFVLGAPFVHMEEASAVYATSGGYCVQNYLKCSKRFLEFIGQDVLRTMYVRSYPRRHMEKWLVWDQSFFLSEILNKVLVYEDSASVSARSLMNQSKLVVFNYFATSFIECLISDTPAILLLSKENLILKKRYEVQFEQLMKAGIFHDDPETAAEFVKKIKDDPLVWWQSPSVRIARERFIKTNIGDSELMINYLLNKAS